MATLALALSSAFQLAAPLVLRRAVDGLTAAEGPRRLAGQALLFAGLAGLQACCKFFSRRGFLGEARGIEYELRRAYFGHLIRLPPERIEGERRGDLLSRAVTDLQDVRLFLGVGLLNFVQTFLLLAAAAGFLWRLHPGLTLAALAPFPAVTLLVGRMSPRLHRRYLAANRRAGELTSLVQEGLSALRHVRAYGREDWQAARFAEASRAVREAEGDVARLSGTLFPGVALLAGLGQVVVLAFGGALVARGELTLGGFVAFNAYLALLVWPMVALGWTLGLVQRGAAGFERLQEVLSWPPEPDGRLALPAAPASGGTCLEARGVSFQHAGARSPVLSDFSLALPEGGVWGLVGATGCGKSTAVALLARLRRPERGLVLAHGRDAAGLAGASLRRHVAVVPQEGFLFSATLAENVLLGRARDEERLAGALEAAGLSEEVSSFPQGWETPVGEGGVTLSGGQRQRVAIARALYGGPGCLLLDAAFSHLDAATARRVLAALRRRAAGLTLLVVSHRGADLEEADGVFFLEGGRVAAQGRHVDLLERVPGYRRLYREEELLAELREAGP